MNTSKKCPQCGLVNFANDELCRRCSADLDAPVINAEQPSTGRSKSTLLVCLCLLVLVGLGIFGYLHKRNTDRELAEKAELMRRQIEATNNPPPTPAPDPMAEQRQRWKEEADKERKQMASYAEALKKPMPVPSPVFSPGR